jgi:hypothetical protein
MRDPAPFALSGLTSSELELGYTMKITRYLPLAAIVLVGCQSSMFRGQSYDPSNPRVEDRVFVHVPESQRQAVTEARSERSQMEDTLTVAQRDLEVERQRVRGARVQRDLAKESVDAARTSYEVAKGSNEAVREREMRNADQDIERALTRWHSAQAQVSYHEARLAKIEAEIKIARLRVDLAESRIELAKAKAVSELDRPAADRVEIIDFENRVEENELRIAMAEVDVAAWEEKLRLQQEVLDSRKQAQQSRERDSGRDRNRD